MNSDRVPLPSNALIQTVNVEDINCKVYYKIKENDYQRGGSGIIYKARECDSNGKETGTDLCLKEYYPSSGFERDPRTWKIVPSMLSLNDGFTEKILGNAIQEKEAGQKIRNASDDKPGTMRVVAIKKVMMITRLTLDSGENFAFSDCGSIIAVMDDHAVMSDHFDGDSYLLANVVSAIKKEQSKNVGNEQTYEKLLYGKGLSPYAVFCIMKKILDALKVINSKGYTYGDAQPKNIIFEAPDFAAEDFGKVVFCDFGSALKIEDNGYTKIPEVVVTTMDYVAPEQLGHERLSVATDIYQAGMLLWYLISNQIQNDEKYEPGLSKRWLRKYGIRTADCGRIKQLIDSATEQNPTERCSIDDFIKAVEDLRKEYQKERYLIQDDYIQSNLLDRQEDILHIKELLKGNTKDIFVWSNLKGIGKTTLMRMLVHSDIGKRVYYLEYINNLFSTIASAPVSGIIDSGYDIEMLYDEKMDVLQNLDKEDVLIIDGIDSDKVWETKAYYDLIKRCPAKIIFTTNYNMSWKDGNFELTGFSNDILMHEFEKNFTGLVDHDKMLRILKLLDGHVYLFSLICAIIRDTQKVDNVINAFDNAKIPQTGLLIEKAKKDKYVYSNENLLEILNSLYKVSSLTEKHWFILRAASLIQTAKVDYDLFCNSLGFSTISVDSFEFPVDQDRSDEWHGAVNELCSRNWLKKGFQNGHLYLYRPHMLVRTLVNSNTEISEDLLLDLAQGTSLALSIRKPLSPSIPFFSSYQYVYDRLCLFDDTDNIVNSNKGKTTKRYYEHYLQGCNCLSNGQYLAAMNYLYDCPIDYCNIRKTERALIGLLYAIAQLYIDRDDYCKYYEEKFYNYLLLCSKINDKTISNDTNNIIDYEEMAASVKRDWNIIKKTDRYSHDMILDEGMNNTGLDDVGYEFCLPNENALVDNDFRNLYFVNVNQSQKVDSYINELCNWAYKMEKEDMSESSYNMKELVSGARKFIFRNRIKQKLYFQSDLKADIEFALLHIDSLEAIYSENEDERKTHVWQIELKRKHVHELFYERKDIRALEWTKYSLALRLSYIEYLNHHYPGALFYWNEFGYASKLDEKKSSKEWTLFRSRKHESWYRTLYDLYGSLLKAATVFDDKELHEIIFVVYKWLNLVLNCKKFLGWSQKDETRYKDLICQIKDNTRVSGIVDWEAMLDQLIKYKNTDLDMYIFAAECYGNEGAKAIEFLKDAHQLSLSENPENSWKILKAISDAYYKASAGDPGQDMVNCIEYNKKAIKEYEETSYLRGDVYKEMIRNQMIYCNISKDSVGFCEACKTSLNLVINSEQFLLDDNTINSLSRIEEDLSLTQDHCFEYYDLFLSLFSGGEYSYTIDKLVKSFYIKNK